LANIEALARNEGDSGHYGTCDDESNECTGTCPICKVPLKGSSGRKGPLTVTGTDGCHAH